MFSIFNDQVRLATLQAFMIRHRWQILATLVLLLLSVAAALWHPAAGLGIMAMGAMSFNNLPTGVRVPLFYAEMDNSQAGYFTQNKRALLVGQMLSTGTATAKLLLTYVY